MKALFICSLLLASSLSGLAADVAPEALSGVLAKDKAVKVQAVTVVHDKGLAEAMAVFDQAAQKNPEVAKEVSAKLRDGYPLPYEPKLGVSKQDYDKYMALWEKRRVEPVAEGLLRLEQNKNGSWRFRGAGVAEALSLLEYDAAKDEWTTSNGVLKRIKDIDQGKEAILGEWKGREWSFEDKGSLGTTKENVAIGKTSNGKHAYVIWRLIDISPEGRLVADNGVILRFDLASGEQDSLLEEARKKAAKDKKAKNN